MWNDLPEWHATVRWRRERTLFKITVIYTKTNFLCGLVLVWTGGRGPLKSTNVHLNFRWNSLWVSWLPVSDAVTFRLRSGAALRVTGGGRVTNSGMCHLDWPTDIQAQINFSVLWDGGSLSSTKSFILLFISTNVKENGSASWNCQTNFLADKMQPSLVLESLTMKSSHACAEMNLQEMWEILL